VNNIGVLAPLHNQENSRVSGRKYLSFIVLGHDRLNCSKDPIVGFDASRRDCAPARALLILRKKRSRDSADRGRERHYLEILRILITVVYYESGVIKPIRMAYLTNPAMS
jgi:hypothetical protein